MRRTLGGLAVVVAVLVPASGCSLTGGPKPDDATATLASALAKRDVSGVAFSGTTGKAAQAELAPIVAGMKSVPAKVRAVDVQADGDRASAVLVWSWSVAGRTWTTRSPVDLRRSGDAWHPVWSRTLVNPKLAAGDVLDATDLLPTRGDIVGANDRKIVTDRQVIRYGFDKTGLPAAQAEAGARRLATLLKIDPATFADRVAKATAYVDAVTIRTDGSNPDESAVTSIPGARATAAMLPLAPTKDFAAPLLGAVGQPTAEMIKKSKDRITATDQVGIGGLQARYDSTLRGTSGEKISIVDAKKQGTVVFRAPAVDGKPLAITLDVNLQTLAERALAGTTSPAALVAIRPSTGDVLAAASGPASKGQNTATFGRYAPGSTFKVVSSLALLRSGVTPDTQVTCPPTVSVDGKTFKNYSDYPASALGRIPFRTAIANSCNTAVIGLHGKLSADSLGDAAAALGMGADHDTGFSSYFGSVPAATSETEGAADMIGQGKVEASPLTMAVVAASVEKGSAVVPRLVSDHATDPAKPAEPLTATEADQLRTLMRGVVTDGSGRLLLDVPGAPVLAKTGTAEYGAKAPLKTHAWMIAIHGDLAVAVFVGDGASGSGVAGPILKQFLLGAG
jgi:cell division protein FtsI/penicillin-binding protein 2